jgi:hypothetical protein
VQTLRPPSTPDLRQVLAGVLLDWCGRLIRDFEASNVAPVPWQSREVLRKVFGVVRALVPEEFAVAEEESEDW